MLPGTVPGVEVKVEVLVTQSCPTLCDPVRCSPPGSPLSMGFSKQEYWSGLPCPPLEDLPDPGIKPQSPALQLDSLLQNQQGSLLTISTSRPALTGSLKTTGESCY